jgi:hypothetical protein
MMNNNNNLKDVLKSDLCRQYAENENHRQTVIISFITVMIASITTYGLTLKEFILNTKCENLLLYVLATIFSIFIFSIPIIFAIILGYYLRRDQIIVDKIRREVFEKNENENVQNTIKPSLSDYNSDYENIFSIYNPKKSKYNFLQDFNIAIIRISLVFQVFLAFLFCFITSCCFINELDCSCLLCGSCCFVFLALIISLIIVFLVFLKYSKKYSRVMNKNQQFND